MFFSADACSSPLMPTPATYMSQMVMCIIIRLSIIRMYAVYIYISLSLSLFVTHLAGGTCLHAGAKGTVMEDGENISDIMKSVSCKI